MRNTTAIFVLVLIVTAAWSVSFHRVRADQPASEKDASEAAAEEDIDVRLARAHLELAKLNLRRAVEENRRIPNVIPATLIENLRLHVVIDQQKLKSCLNGEHVDPHAMCIRRAEAEVTFADADVKRLRSIHERMGTASSKMDLERAEVAAQIAKLNLERNKSPEHLESVTTHLQWQIDELRHHVLELQMEIASRR